MARAAKHTNPIVLKSGMSIGSVSAETDDEFLFDCFVRHAAVEESLNLKSPGMILAGRTGSGKTAIIRFLEHNAEHSVAIDPFDMALSYVSNSDILSFLHNIGADLDLLFQVLWKHVLCIEFIRLRFQVHDEIQSKKIFASIFERFNPDQRRRKALQYLRDWESKFWITMDQNIKEITDKYVGKLKAELGADLPALKAGGQAEGEISGEKKLELISRTKNIINPEQLAELAGVIDILSADLADDDRMLKYFVVLDKLDERWVDDSIRFRLVRALIESLRAFRKIQNLKILVALRSDILERVIQETADLGFQREKYEDYFIRLKWKKAELKELVQKRISHLFKRRYTADNITFEDIFPNKVGGQDAFDYLVERTLMRPRDIISFVNQCINRADGNYEVTPRFVTEAEREYSRIRREAIENEWQSAFPSISKLFRFLSARKATFAVSELLDDPKLDELAFEIGSDPKMERDPLFAYACDSFGSKNANSNRRFLEQSLAILYRVGAIGLKLRPEEKFIYSHSEQAVVTPEVLTPDVRIRIHPMLHQILNVRR